MRVLYYLIWVFISLALVGCVEPFEPEISAYDNSLVVEGQILEGKQPAIVRLSRSFALNQQEPEKISNAQIGIRNDAGEEIALSEIEPGVYQSDTSQYEGVPGNSYQLFFEVGGNSYESSWMLMKKSAELNEVTWQLEDQLVGNNSIKGVQFYLNTSDPEKETIYYRWEYAETWEFLVPFQALGLWNSLNLQPDYYHPDSIPERCWRMGTSSRIMISTTEGLTEDKIVDFPFHFVSTQENQFRVKYSLLLKQYSISEETYRFYQQLKATTEDLGTLFDPIPTEVKGNIRNINNPEESILGFFSADGYDSQRIFVENADLDSVLIPDGFQKCEPDTLFTGPEMDAFVGEGGAFVEVLLNFDGSFYAYLGSRAECTDCRLSGSFDEPDFW